MSLIFQTEERNCFEIKILFQIVNKWKIMIVEIEQI